MAGPVAKEENSLQKVVGSNPFASNWVENCTIAVLEKIQAAKWNESPKLILKP